MERAQAVNLIPGPTVTCKTVYLGATGTARGTQYSAGHRAGVVRYGRYGVRRDRRAPGVDRAPWRRVINSHLC